MATKEKEREATDRKPSQSVVPSLAPHKQSTPFALSNPSKRMLRGCVCLTSARCVSHTASPSPPPLSLSQVVGQGGVV